LSKAERLEMPLKTSIEERIYLCHSDTIPASPASCW
jgi:hypothetical protein